MEKQKIKYPLAYLEQVGGDILDKISPFCTRKKIAGSVRRKRSEGHDIEFVLIPKTMMVNSGDLFDPLKEVRVPGFINAIEKYFLPDIAEKNDIKLIGDPAHGKYFRRITPEGIQLDFFTAEKDNWGYILVLRTGGKTFNKWMMSPTGFKARGYKCTGGTIVRACDNVVMPTCEEEDVFKLLGANYIYPEFRT